MIIGNNTNNNNNNLTNSNFTQSFEQKFNRIKEGKMNNNQNNIQNQIRQKHFDVTNQNEMADKSILLLQERLRNGLITLEEFNKKCNQINKTRQK